MDHGYEIPIEPDGAKYFLCDNVIYYSTTEFFFTFKIKRSQKTRALLLHACFYPKVLVVHRLLGQQT